jgi:ATP-dependent DNA helicase RecQ
LTSNKAILTEYFPSIPSFRDIQEQVIDTVVSGNNTLCLMGTGSGKSLVYQVAALRLKKTALVISPLVALMLQQHERLIAAKLSSEALHAGLGGKASYETLRKMTGSGLPTFLFVSPERIATDGFVEYVLRRERAEIGLVVIDEAHCVSQWGHNFRPSYKLIPECLNNVFGIQNWPPVLCLTATLNPKDELEIMGDFRVAEKNVCRSRSVLRKNIQIFFQTLDDENAKKERLAEILDDHKGKKIIVYTHRKQGKYGTRAFADEFRQRGFNCAYFDADAGESHKDHVLGGFERGEIRVVFATNAFGMGVDIPDIRVVVHYLIPESIEQYYQEVGRSGRDAKPSFAYLLYSPVNVKVRKSMINAAMPSASEIKAVYERKFKPQKGIGSLNPWLDVSDQSRDILIFHQLVKFGVLQILGKGIRNITCFQDKREQTKFSDYLKATVTGSPITISKKTGTSIAEIMRSLFDLYSEAGISLTSNPAKALFYSLRQDLSDTLNADICKQFKEKLDYRLRNFDEFLELVESGIEPEQTICRYLGISLEN